MPSDDRRGARLAALLAFSSFFVFPAIPVGRTGAITIPFAIAIGMVALWLPRLRASEWWPYACIMAPVAVSAGACLLAGTALAPDIVPKAVLATAVTFLALVPARRLLREGHADAFVSGAAYAILVHAAIGAYQVLAFERGEFPLTNLMRTNPSMALITEDIPTYVEYVKRPFGLFAEPSAMAACIGPWLVVIANALFARGREGQRRRTIVRALALAGGSALVVASKSGLAAPIVVGVAIAALAAAFSGRRGFGTRGAALLLGVTIAAASASWLETHAASRFEFARNDSWQARLGSLELGVRSLAASADSGGELLFGVGPGQSYATVNSTARKYQVDAGVTAVWSVGLTHAIETGLVGILGMLVLAGAAAWSIWASRARVAGAACALVWLSGLLIGTSLVGQPALWTGLAALLSWRSIAQARPARSRPGLQDEIGRAPSAADLVTTA
jgi:hypothetical protein